MQLAADQDDPKALRYMGEVYLGDKECNNLIEIDREKGWAFIGQAADAGDTDAQTRNGVVLLSPGDEPVETRESLRIKHLTLASSRNDPNADKTGNSCNLMALDFGWYSLV